jgi:DNA polymerase III subunit beta
MARKSVAAGGRKATRIKAGMLAAVLDDVADLVPSKDTIPILTHVLIEAGHQELTVTATNLDAEAQRACRTDDRDGPNSAEWLDGIVPFAAAVQATAMHKLVKQFDKDAMVTLTLDEDTMRLTVAAGRARFVLATLPVADFPRWAGADAGRKPAATDFSMACGVLADALAQTGFAAGDDPTRYYLGGVYVHAADLDLRFAATDGHRLSRVRMDAPDGAACAPDLILPRGVLKPLDKWLGHAVKAAGEDHAAQVDIEMGEDGRWISFAIELGDSGRVVLSTKGIDGTFPDYARVIPTEAPLSLIVQREALASAIKRVLSIADKSRFIQVALSEDCIRLTVTADGVGQASEDVPCIYDGAALELGVNGAYWREALSALACDEVSMRLTDHKLPIRLEPHGADDGGRLVQVLMPAAF